MTSTPLIELYHVQHQLSIELAEGLQHAGNIREAARVHWVEKHAESWVKGSVIVNRTTLLLVGSVLALSVNACDAKKDVPFEELVSNPERYHGRQVCTEGIHATGFEVNALGASVRREGDAVYLTEPVIWLEGAEIRSSTSRISSVA